MTQEDYPLSDLDCLQSKNNITEDNLRQLPELSSEEPKNFPSKTMNQEINLSHQPINLQSARTTEPKSEKQRSPQDSYFKSRKRMKNPRSNIAYNKNLQFQFTLTYKVTKNNNL